MSKLFSKQLISLTEDFSNKLKSIKLTFKGYVYNPLEYAKDNFYEYLDKYVKENADNLFLGMNPGPFGMAQTGIPFGEINAVKNYLCINNKVSTPSKMHPKKRILGMDISRSETSGLRFWGLIKSTYSTAEMFSNENAVLNYCPLCFIEDTLSGKNVTPEMLPKEDREEITYYCNSYLKDMIRLINPKRLIGIGQYAYNKLKEVSTLSVFYMLHPSPLNPKANKNWIENQKKFLIENKIWTDVDTNINTSINSDPSPLTEV